MIDLGSDDPEAAEILEHALYIVEHQLNHFMQHDSLDSPLPETSEINRLHESTSTSPLSIKSVLQIALHSASSSLQQIAYTITHSVPTTRVALQSLMRVALLGTARTALVLLPSDPKQRLKNAKMVLAQDCQSGIRALEEYAKFQGMRAMSPPAELLADLRQQRANLYPQGRVPGEGTVIKRQTEAFIQALQMAQEGQDDAVILEDVGPEILRDHASWLWNTYSGLAHAYSWPRLLPGISADPNMPGDFPLDFYMVANSCVMAFSAYLDRAVADSACTTTPVNLSSRLP